MSRQDLRKFRTRYDLAYDHFLAAAKFAEDRRYPEAIQEYRAAIRQFEQSAVATAPKRIEFCHAEIARLEEHARDAVELRELDGRS
ncbi:MAG TPA: hypothetical protein VK540_16025 [Polyangiaceae bacterium]|nr:hypothetical protein [Polyangiaceae bacterium]